MTMIGGVVLVLIGMVSLIAGVQYAGWVLAAGLVICINEAT